MEKLHRIDTSNIKKGTCQHGYPIDFWDDEAQTVEAEETSFDRRITWAVCAVIVGVSAFFLWY